MSKTSKLKESSKLGDISGYFFLAGLTCSNIKYPPLALIFTTLSLSFYFIAYTTWLAASYLYPDHTKHHQEWYGFAQFKQQHLLASMLGLAATALSVASIFFPILLIPTAWVFLASNALWATGEYHKLKNPLPEEENYSHSKQKAYTSYAVALTSITLTTAVSATLAFAFPPIGVPVLIIATILSIAFSALALESWLDATFGKHKLDKNSYNKMGDSLGSSAEPELEAVYDVAPSHNPTPLKSQKEVNIELVPLESENNRSLYSPSL